MQDGSPGVADSVRTGPSATSQIRFMITKPAAPKMDRDTRQQKVAKTTGALGVVTVRGKHAGRD